jgi:hypothetical protein
MDAGDLFAWALIIALFVFRGAVLAVAVYVVVAVVRGLLRPAEPGASAHTGAAFAPGKPSNQD